jgi:hypothetical protein
MGKSDHGSTKLELRELEPWPEQVDGAVLLNDLSGTFSRHLALLDGAADVMALWVMFTHGFDAAKVSPRLGLLSPLPECGKTTALSLLGRLVPRPVLASNMSPAVVFRAIEEYGPTLLMDEADTYLEQNDEFRGILNSGHTPDTANVWRCSGQDHEPKSFTTWAPMAIAKIGTLPDTLTTRSIIIPMRRKRPDEYVEKFDTARHRHSVDELARKAARWAKENLETLGQAKPEMPEELRNRAADNWTPLLAIADTAGGDWPERGRLVAVMSCGGVAEATLQEQLLADIQDVFLQCQLDRISSNQLCGKLGCLEGRPWGRMENGCIIAPSRLASLLRPFGIKPHSIRIGQSTPKGYELKDFEDAFARYLPEKRNTATSEEQQGMERSVQDAA